MPIRMIRDWTDSEKVDRLSPQAEVLFIRLMMKADDFGCFHAHPALVKSFCFPLRDNVRNTDISRWIEECQSAGLLVTYADPQSGKNFLQILNFGQRMKQSRHKFPPPPDRGEPELPGTSGNFREQEWNGKQNTENEKERDNAPAHGEKSSELMIAAEEIAKIYPKAKVGDFRALTEAVASAIGREITEVGRDLHEAIATVKTGTTEYAEAVKLWKDKSFISTPEKFYNSGMYNHDPETFKREAKGDKIGKKRFDPADPTTWPTE